MEISFEDGSLYSIQVRAVLVSPSAFGSFHKFSSQIKNALIPHGEQGQKIHSCGTTLFAGAPATLHGANTPSALNAGNTSSDTWVSLFPVPSAAHLLLRFSPHSQHRGLSVDAPAALLPPQRFSMIEVLKHKAVRLSRTFFRTLRTSTAQASV